MATGGVPLWSTTASSNATADPGINWAEGQAPSTVNNSARGEMASIANWRDDLYGRTTSGTSTAYTVTTGSTFASASDMSGAVFCIIPHTTSGASPTLAVDGLTARQIRLSTGVNVPTGALVSGTPYLVKYVHATTEFILVGNVGVQRLSEVDIIGATQETTIAADDTFPLYDLSATANRRMLLSDILKVVNLLTADSSPDAAADYVLTYDASASAAKKVLLANLPSALPRGYIDGCILSNNSGDATNDIDISAGVCRDSTNAVDIVVPAITGKQLDANWAAGSAAGMRNSAAGITNTTYHIWAVRTAASSAGDIYAHTSATASTVLTALQAETGGASYAYARMIGSIVRTGGAVKAFSQTGNTFLWDAAVQDIANTADHTTAVLAALTVPTGIKVEALFHANVINTSSGNHGTLFSSPDITDAAPNTTAAPGISVGSESSRSAGQFKVRTDTSGRIRYRATTNSIDTWVQTYGFEHPRGRDA
jgi:hypothetical protein